MVSKLGFVWINERLWVLIQSYSLSWQTSGTAKPLRWTGKLHVVHHHERDHHPAKSVTKPGETWLVGAVLYGPFLRYKVPFGLFLALEISNLSGGHIILDTVKIYFWRIFTFLGSKEEH